MSRQSKTMWWGDRELTYKEIAFKLSITYETFYNMMKVRKFNTKEEVIAHREVLRKTNRKVGGHKPKQYKTSEGIFTFKQMAEHHGSITHQAMRNRCYVWGYDHKCIWLQNNRRVEFYRLAISLDGLPRGKKADRIKCEYIKPENLKLPINRTKACLKDKGQSKCIHYRARWLSEDDNPIECKDAEGDSCSNFTGKKVEAGLRDNNGESTPRQGLFALGIMR